jgi:DNA-binding NtrC family response regulator
MMTKVVLVVDDDEGVRDIAVDLVEAFGYVARAVDNARAALAIVANEAIDAVFTDVVMPGMNGYQLAQRLHEIAPQLPVICVTGYADVPEDGRHCLVVLQKPYRAATLRTALDKALAT